MSTKSRMRKLIIGFVVVFVCMFSWFAYEGSKASVTIMIDGQEKQVRTHADTVEELLKELNIKVTEEDEIKPSLDEKVINDLKVEWIPAKTVSIIIDKTKKEIQTTKKTIDEALKQANISLHNNDAITPPRESPIEEGMEIKVKKAFPVSVVASGEQKEVWTTSTTVADLLNEQDIQVSKFDKVIPGLFESVEKDAEIKVIEVEKITDVVEEAVDYAVITRSDSSVIAGNKKVLKEGKEGLVKNYYEVTYEDGVEVSRELIKSEKIKNSQDQIVAVGTKQLDYEIARGGKVVKEMTVRATAYTAYCNGCSGTTRTGINLRKNPHLKVIAVDPTVIPLGTKVWVEGYGYAIAGDTGGAIKGNRIDLFIPDEKEVYKYGIKPVKIRILE